MRLSRRPEPFDSEEYLYELKIDGFRALAHVSDGKGELVSRNGKVFRGFAELAAWIAKHLKIENAVLDGEIACIDGEGRPVFRELLFRKSPCITCSVSQQSSGKRERDDVRSRSHSDVLLVVEHVGHW
jgi:ATP-dependent DNA ligase